MRPQLFTLQFLTVILLLTGFTSCKKDTDTVNVTGNGKLFGTVQTWDDKLNSTPGFMQGLTKVAIFITTFDAESQCLINHKCV